MTGRSGGTYIHSKSNSNINIINNNLNIINSQQ